MVKIYPFSKHFNLSRNTILDRILLILNFIVKYKHNNKSKQKNILIILKHFIKNLVIF